MNVMVTGGAGYIGSHAVQRLLRDGHTVVCVDNLSRGHREPMDLLSDDRLTFAPGDLSDKSLLSRLLAGHEIDTIMHFAALTYVGESVQQPLAYYRNNTAGALNLLEAADAVGVERFVFSSTAATYGEPPPERIPIQEDCPQEPINPYGQSKLAVERILTDWASARRAAGRPVAFAALRYFNVAGCDRSGVLGEDHDPETHLIPVVLQACLGQREAVTMFGTDYPTPDGTCIRDYVHVEDLIDAHVHTMLALRPGDARRYNLGIGAGYSVRQIIDAVRAVTGVEFEVREGARRPGDPPSLFADPSRIRADLGWSAATRDVHEIVETAWKWFKAHPHGYAST
ncbi:MAG: UDP-glucose 4-epimerase GalE [Phycisphaeraceae bacterium]|nr:UDP-glucose 4-epimerase GalE [Phycisphaeraceae bacterium]